MTRKIMIELEVGDRCVDTNTNKAECQYYSEFDGKCVLKNRTLCLKECKNLGVENI